MNHKNYPRITAFFFLGIALLHFWRALSAWEAVINGVVIPVWLSWIVVVIAGYLAYEGFTKSRK